MIQPIILIGWSHRRLAVVVCIPPISELYNALIELIVSVLAERLVGRLFPILSVLND